MKSFNFGFHGYGPHQMLALLENQLERTVVGEYSPGLAVYQALPEHIERCLGKTMWNILGPRYAIDTKGEIVYTGAIASGLAQKLRLLQSRSHVLSRIFQTPFRPTQQDIDLYVEIIQKSKAIFAERYSGQFIVLFWNPNGHPASEKILSAMRTRGLNVVEVTDILNDFEEKKGKYLIKDGIDPHPNPFAYERVAEYLLTHLTRFWEEGSLSESQAGTTHNSINNKLIEQ